MSPISRIPTYPMPDGSDSYPQRLATALQDEAHQRVLDFDVLKLGNVPHVDVRVYGASDGADNTVSIQAAMDSLTSGGIVLFPSDFESILTDKLTVGYNSIVFQGHGKSSKLTMQTGDYDYPIIYATGKNNIMIRDLYFYGNKGTNVAWGTNFAGAIELDDVTDFRIENCFMENMTGGKAAIYMSGGCHRGVIGGNRLLTMNDSGITAKGDTGGAPIDLNIVNNYIQDTDSKNGIFILGGSTAADPAPRNCYIAGNQIQDQDDVGIEVNGGSSTNGGYGHRIIGNRVDGGHSGILVRKSRYCTVVGNWCYNSDNAAGIAFGWDTPHSDNNIAVGNICKTNTTSGIRINNGSHNLVSSNHCYDNGTYGVEELGASADYNYIVANRLRGNTTADVVILGSNTECEANKTSTAVNVASAATVTLPPDRVYFNITGTTNITSVTASWAGRRVVFRFAGILTFTDGSNLKLAGNLVTTADDTICLVCNGTNWYEESRSVN